MSFTNSLITLFTKFFAELIRPGLMACLHRRRSVSPEKRMMIPGKRLWRSSRSRFICATMSTLFNLPRSLLPQQMSRTAGADCHRSIPWMVERRPLHRSPPLPNHLTWAARPRFVPVVWAALSRPRRT